jgi:hypothetical protein
MKTLIEDIVGIFCIFVLLPVLLVLYGAAFGMVTW